METEAKKQTNEQIRNVWSEVQGVRKERDQERVKFLLMNALAFKKQKGVMA